MTAIVRVDRNGTLPEAVVTIGRHKNGQPVSEVRRHACLLCLRPGERGPARLGWTDSGPDGI
jgi:hypothetical protein